MELTTKFKETVKPERVRMQIALEAGETFSTLTRWVNTKSELLTQKRILKAIEKITGLKENQIFKLEKATA